MSAILSHLMGKKMWAIVIAALTLSCCGAAHAAAAPDVIYTAFGTFAAPALSGQDRLCLAGQPFTISIVANEALKPTKHNATSALYTNLSMQGTVSSCLLPGPPLSISSSIASIGLRVGANGQPDELQISFPLSAVSAQLTVSAPVIMPAGTISTPAIMPFTNPVTLSANATVTYADSYASTTLGIAVGTLDAAVGTPPPQALTVLHNFRGQAPDGAGPAGPLAVGQGGKLYGTTQQSIVGGGDGTVFQLTPPAALGGTWTQTDLHLFQGPYHDGEDPVGGVVLGANGALYGTTASGGRHGLGTVFELTPPASSGGAWSETLLYNFTGSNGDGNGPWAGVLIGPNGALYGTTTAGGSSNLGTVFQLTPPATPGGAWTETVLHSFTGQGGDGATPYASLVMGRRCELYGTTADGGNSGNGTVFELSPGGAETVLYSFGGPRGDGRNPRAGLAIGPNGALYGTTQYGGATGSGAVFQLTPPATPGGAWIEAMLYSFQGPAAGDGANPTGGLLISPSGALYGTTSGGGILGSGTAFKLTPPAAPGGTWTETLLTAFTFFDGANPNGGLVAGAGALYGTAESGGAFGFGTVFQWKP